MIHLLEKVGFNKHCLLVHFGKFFQFYLFHCSNCEGDFVGDQVHPAITTLTQNLPNSIVVSNIIRIYLNELTLFHRHSGQELLLLRFLLFFNKLSLLFIGIRIFVKIKYNFCLKVLIF